jgi:glutamyl-tRNA reductase
MTQNFKALVLSYKTAPVSIREQVSLNEEGSKQLLHFMRDYTQATDVLVVSTCNRTEVYYVAEADYAEVVLKGISLLKKTDHDIGRFSRLTPETKRFSIFLKSHWDLMRR